MSGTAVLLCSGTGLAGRIADAVLVDDLCTRPAAAAAALREAGATRAVLGLCDRQPSSELLHALRAAGAVPFGIEAAVLGTRSPAEAGLLVAALRAKLDALATEDRGRPMLVGGGLSRRSLLRLSPAVTRTPVAVVDEAECVGSDRCGLCGNACPVGAIDLRGSVPVVDEVACDACGRCVPRCPRGAVRLAGASTAQLEAQLDVLVPAVPGVVIACRSADVDAPDGWPVVRLPTLGLVSAGWFLQLAARGASVRLAPCAEECLGEARDAERFAADVVHAAGDPRGGPELRLRLDEPRASADAVRLLARPERPFLLVDDASPLGVLELLPGRCTVCGACATACPTDALVLETDRAAVALRHDPAACVACGRCAEVCPEGSLRVTRAVDSERLRRGPFELAVAEVEACAVCGDDLPPLPMRLRLRDLLPGVAAATPLELCAACAAARPAYDRTSSSDTRGMRDGREGNGGG